MICTAVLVSTLTSSTHLPQVAHSWTEVLDVEWLARSRARIDLETLCTARADRTAQDDTIASW